MDQHGRRMGRACPPDAIVAAPTVVQQHGSSCGTRVRMSLQVVVEGWAGLEADQARPAATGDRAVSFHCSMLLMVQYGCFLTRAPLFTKNSRVRRVVG